MQSSGAFAVPRRSDADLELLRTTAGAALLHAGFLAMAWYAPPSMDALRLDRLAAIHDRFLSFEVRPPKVERTEEVSGDRRAERTAGGHALRPKPAPPGRRGVRRTHRRAARRGPKDPAALRRRVREMDVFSMLGQLDRLTSTGPMLPAVVTPGDPVTADGNPLGVVIGHTAGAGGESLGIDATSFMRGEPTSARPALRARKTRFPPRSMEVTDDGRRLPRSAVRRALRRQRNAIRACYEEALRFAPELEGKVVVRFTVGPGGRVLTASVASSTLNAPKAERCIVERVRHLRLPAVPDGGVTEVSYPFVFRRLQ